LLKKRSFSPWQYGVHRSKSEILATTEIFIKSDKKVNNGAADDRRRSEGFVIFESQAVRRRRSSGKNIATGLSERCQT
jgi:hypothetical protein